MKLENKILDRVDTLSSKLNEMGTHAWESLIRYEITLGIMQVVSSIVILLITIIMIGYFIKKYKDFKRTDIGNILIEYDREWSLTFFGCFFAIATVLMLLACIPTLAFMLPNGILRITNPEIYAVKDIIQEFNQGGTQ